MAEEVVKLKLLIINIKHSMEKGGLNQPAFFFLNRAGSDVL